MDTSTSAEAVFRKNSRSFSLAARFFAPEDRLAVARLYRFCRYLDDLADDTRTGDPEALDLARDRIAGEAAVPTDSVEAEFLALVAEREIPVEPALELIAALRGDCGERFVRDPDELVRFAYGVAGTVGRMMRHVIGAFDERADPFAIDLGIALQLSNVIRDIAEDARRGRFYLPAEWVESETILRAMEGHADAIARVDQAVNRALALSEEYYESARRGLAYIPARNRRVIFLAAALYQEIGRKTDRSRPGGWRQRTVVGPGEKLRVLLRSPRQYRRWKNEVWSGRPEPEHDGKLHLPLVAKSEPNDRTP